jgi:hypothetical protein
MYSTVLEIRNIVEVSDFGAHLSVSFLRLRMCFLPPSSSTSRFRVLPSTLETGTDHKFFFLSRERERESLQLT